MRAKLAVLFLLAAGCSGGRLIPGGSGTPDFTTRWQGHAEDDVILQYGTPTERIALANGNTVDSYHREMAQSGSSSFAYGNVGSGHSQSSTVFCDRRFEIDKGTGRVVRAVISGNSCDYNL